MATYNINLTGAVTPNISIPDGGNLQLSYTNLTANANALGTGIRLLGQNAIDYGLVMDENLVHLLENFANNLQPNAALRGQLWYDTTVTPQFPFGVLKVCTVASSANAVAEFSIVGGGGSGGPDNAVQLNDGAGGFTGSANLTFASQTLAVSGNTTVTGSLTLGTSNPATLRSSPLATIATTLTLPPDSGSNLATLTTDGFGNLSWQLTRHFIANGTSNVFVDDSGNITMSVGGLANQFVLTTNALRLGNNNLFVNGILANGNISANGNLSGNNLSLTGNIIANGMNFGNTGNASLFNSANIANVWLGPVSNVHITGGSGGQLLSTDGTGNLSWATVSTSGLSNGSSDVSIAVANGPITANVEGNLALVLNPANIRVGSGFTFISNTETVLGNVGNVKIYGGNPGDIISTDGNGNLIFSGTGATPNTVGNGGSNVTVPVSSGNLEFNVDGARRLTISQDQANLVANLIVAGTTTLANVANTQAINAQDTVTVSTTISDGNILLYGNGSAEFTGSIIVDNDIATNTLGVLGNSQFNDFVNVFGNGIQVANTFIDNDINTTINNAGITTIGFRLVDFDFGTPNVANTYLTISNTSITSNLNVDLTGANVSLGAVANLHITGGPANFFLKTDGAGTLSWSNIAPSWTVSGQTTTNTLSVTNAATVGSLSSAGAANVGRINVGTVTTTAGAGEIAAQGDIIAFASDDRLKTRLGNVENALDKIDSLSTFYFEFNDLAVGMGMRQGRYVGVSAQETQAVMPEIVRPAPVDDGYLTVQYEKFAPLLIAAIKELRAEIRDIRSRL